MSSHQGKAGSTSSNRVRSSNSGSSVGAGLNKNSFSIRLNDLLDDAVDEYGIEMKDDVIYSGVEPPQEIGSIVVEQENSMLGEDYLAPEFSALNSQEHELNDDKRSGEEGRSDDESIGREDTPDKSSLGSDASTSKERSKVGALLEKVRHKAGKKLAAKQGGTDSLSSSPIRASVVETSVRLATSALSFENLDKSESSSIASSSPPKRVASFAIGSGSSPNSSTASPSIDRRQERNEAFAVSITRPSDTEDSRSEGKELWHHFTSRLSTMPFARHRYTILALLVAFTLVANGFIAGLLWGVYLACTGFLLVFVSEPRPELAADRAVEDDKWTGVEDRERVEAEIKFRDRNHVVYKGWMNELRGRYSTTTYHVNLAHSVLVRLDGTILRISRPERAMLKHAFHTDPTLKEPEPTMIAQSIYDLTGATVSLRPRRLAKRRWWSRKYPIAIRLAGPHSEISKTDASTSSRMKRSFSLHPKAPSADGIDINTGVPRSESAGTFSEEAVMRGYDPEDITDSEEEYMRESSTERNRAPRANSTSDLADFADKIELGGLKKRGRAIYLFVRAAREKERWFHLLRAACARARKVDDEKDEGRQRRISMPAVNLEHSGERDLGHEFLLYVSNSVQFSKYMSEILMTASTQQKKEQQEPGSVVSVDLGRMKWTRTDADVTSGLVSSANSIASRIFFDFCRDTYWIRQVQEKIQTKLATIHLPYFIERLELSRLDMGTATPHIVGVYAPQVDDWGLWVDFDLKYKGGIRLVLETRVNLMKLKVSLDFRTKTPMLQSGNGHAVSARARLSKEATSGPKSRYSDEELPESPESSPDEDFGAKHNSERPTTKERTGKKILSMVESVAHSSLFQKVASIQNVAKVMEEISSTRLVLNVEVTGLEGLMTVNFPPPPSDRVWYAFRKPPMLSLKAVPQVGERSVDMSAVSTWIETRLRLLLEKNLVVPNMDDVTIPVMSGNQLLVHGAYNR